MLKFIGRKKESTAEYITQHQLFQGQERSDCLSGTLSGSQWDWWDYIVQEKPRIKAAEWQAPNPYTQSVMASLHHCPHIYVSPDSMRGLVFVAQASPSTVATDPFLLSNLPATKRPDAPPHSAALTFDREDLEIMYPADRELVSNLICPEAEIDAVQGLEKFNADVLFQQKFTRMCYSRIANYQSCLITD